MSVPVFVLHTRPSWGERSTSLWSPPASEEGAPIEPGVCGFRNLGNTCYMNATLSCLVQCRELREYFERPAFEDDIDEGAKGGTQVRALAARRGAGRAPGRGAQGELARAFGALMRDVWSGRYRTVAPVDVRRAVGREQAQYLGYYHQDAQVRTRCSRRGATCALCGSAGLTCRARSDA